MSVPEAVRMHSLVDACLGCELWQQPPHVGWALQVEAGTFVCVPPGVEHTFSNPSDAAVRFLNFNTPAGWEGYMRDLAAAAKTGPLTPESIGRVASNYDFHAS
jgi:hypothetical protein